MRKFVYTVVTKKNKRKKRMIFILIFLLSLFGFMIFQVATGVQASAEADKSIEEILQDSVKENLDNLDTSPFEDFLNGQEDSVYNLFGGQSFREKLESVLNGDFGIGYDSFFKAILALLVDEVVNFMPTIMSIVIVAILSGMLSNMKPNFLNKGMGDIVHFVCYCVVITIVLHAFMQMLFLSKDTMNMLKSQMNIVFPVLLTMIAGLGGIVGIKVYQPMVAVLSSMVMNVITSVIFPLFVITTVLSVVSNLSSGIKLDRLTDTLKKTSNWIIGIIFTVFLAFLSIQGITAATHDGVSIRAAKYAISNAIPILGGYIKDGFDLILSSTMLIKNAVGVSGLILLISTIFLPLVKILVFMFGLKFTSAIIEPMSDGRISNFLHGASKNINMIIASIIGTAFMYFITVMLLIASCNVGVT